MIGYLHDNTPEGQEWGETAEAIIKKFQEAKEYKEKYEELQKRNYELLENYLQLWNQYQNLWAQKNPQPVWPLWPNAPSIDPYPWRPIDITYTINSTK